MRELPSQEVLQELLRYEPETGKLYWRHRAVARFPTEKQAIKWNNQFVDQEAFKTGRGYLSGTLLDKNYKAHRIIFKLVHGTEPKCIDHINGNPSDNRIENLRSVTVSENNKNAKLSVRNTSGNIGVTWCKRARRWRAYICVDWRMIHLGTYISLDEAAESRKKAEREYGFHENHGREAA